MSEPAEALHEMSPEEEAAFRAAVLEGIAEADAGLLIALYDVEAWVASWGREDELPPPG